MLFQSVPEVLANSIHAGFHVAKVSRLIHPIPLLCPARLWAGASCMHSWFQQNPARCFRTPRLQDWPFKATTSWYSGNSFLKQLRMLTDCPSHANLTPHAAPSTLSSSKRNEFKDAFLAETNQGARQEPPATEQQQLDIEDPNFQGPGPCFTSLWVANQSLPHYTQPLELFSASQCFCFALFLIYFLNVNVLRQDKTLQNHAPHYTLSYAQSILRIKHLLVPEDTCPSTSLYKPQQANTCSKSAPRHEVACLFQLHFMHQIKYSKWENIILFKVGTKILFHLN